MADFNIQPVATQIRPIQGASIGDMVNLARGVQEYQQAQQLNPVQLQAAQQQLQSAQQAYGQAQQMNPLLLQSQQQLTRKGEIELSLEEQKLKERLAYQTFMSDPNNYMTDNKFDDQKFNTSIPKIMPLTGTAALKDLTEVARAQSEALRAKHNLTQEKRSLVAQTMTVMGRAGVTDPKSVNAALDLLVEQNPNDADLKNLVDRGYKPVFNRMPSGSELPNFLIQAGQQMLTPSALQTAFAPSVQLTTTGQTVTTQPGAGAALPTATMGIPGGLQTGAPAAPAANVPAGTSIAPGMRIPYQVRRADQPYMPEPSERADLEAGQAYRNRLVSAQTGLAQNRRNVEEVIGQANKIGSDLFFAKGGIPGQIEQKIRMAIGSEQYDMLAKDLANMALSNTQAMGGVGNTVAGLDMQQVANGTIKVPPEVLVKIARRVQADQTNLDMQANGAQLFSQRFGDNNMKAYQQAWNANADTKIFEAMNIVKEIQDPAKRDAELNRLFPSAAQRSEFLTKYRNLKKLSETGSL